SHAPELRPGVRTPLVAHRAVDQPFAGALSHAVRRQEQSGPVLLGLLRSGDDPLFGPRGTTAGMAGTLDGARRRTGAGSRGLLAWQRAATRTCVRGLHVSGTTRLPDGAHSARRRLLPSRTRP